MSGAKNFEDLIIWQESRVLVNDIYKSFMETRDYGYKDQIQRASVSVMSNIAEGFERNSKKGIHSVFGIFKIVLGRS